ncbi:hypothetical protein AB0D04_04250 [Streptomyces sp. NPDC048483]|uniref:hypothetical protein n=1 Tax=Streptomyces sp. NPDC048483 TaxID=3154927 RepID=UPI00341CB63B
MSFLPGPDEALDEVCNVDACVQLPDGSRWSATLFTVAEAERLMARWAETGEESGGRPFWCPDGLIVKDPGIPWMVEAITALLDAGDFRRVLQRLDRPVRTRVPRLTRQAAAAVRRRPEF